MIASHENLYTKYPETALKKVKILGQFPASDYVLMVANNVCLLVRLGPVSDRLPCCHCSDVLPSIVWLT